MEAPIEDVVEEQIESINADIVSDRIPKLTPDAIKKLVCHESLRPVLQVLGVRYIANGKYAGRYQLDLSDGVNSFDQCIASDLPEGGVDEFDIIALDNYTFKTSGENPRPVSNLFILVIERLQFGKVVAKVIGDPKPFSFYELPCAAMPLQGVRTIGTQTLASIDTLPDEVISRIFKSLGCTELITIVPLVCQRWKNLAQRPELWQTVVADEFWSGADLHRVLKRKYVRMNVETIDVRPCANEIFLQEFKDETCSTETNSLGEGLIHRGTTCPKLRCILADGVDINQYDEDDDYAELSVDEVLMRVADKYGHLQRLYSDPFGTFMWHDNLDMNEILCILSRFPNMTHLSDVYWDNYQSSHSNLKGWQAAIKKAGSKMLKVDSFLTTLQSELGNKFDNGLSLISTTFPAIKDLYLVNSELTPEDIQQFTDAHGTQLKSLFICSTDEAVLGGIAQSKVFNTVEKLMIDPGIHAPDIEDNEARTLDDIPTQVVTDAGIKLLTKGCSFVKTFRVGKLIVSKNTRRKVEFAITDKSLQSIGCNWQALTRLEICNATVTTAGISELAEGCKKLRRLKLKSLNAISVLNEKTALALSRMPWLEYLELPDNGLSISFLFLLTVIAHTQRLVRLDVSDAQRAYSKSLASSPHSADHDAHLYENLPVSLRKALTELHLHKKVYLRELVMRGCRHVCDALIGAIYDSLPRLVELDIAQTYCTLASVNVIAKVQRGSLRRFSFTTSCMHNPSNGNMLLQVAQYHLPLSHLHLGFLGDGGEVRDIITLIITGTRLQSLSFIHDEFYMSREGLDFVTAYIQKIHRKRAHYLIRHVHLSEKPNCKKAWKIVTFRMCPIVSLYPV